jgi:hypothetical protein
MPNEKRKPKGEEREIRELKYGLPKVIEYWEMVKQEMDEHFAQLTARKTT